jgi:hypothetical protein
VFAYNITVHRCTHPYVFNLWISTYKCKQNLSLSLSLSPLQQWKNAKNNLFLDSHAHYIYIYTAYTIALICQFSQHVSKMKNAAFWDVMPYGSCKNRRFGGTYHLHHQGDKNRLTRNNVSFSCWLLLMFILAHRFLSPCWLRWYLSLFFTFHLISNSIYPILPAGHRM